MRRRREPVALTSGHIAALILLLLAEVDATSVGQTSVVVAQAALTFAFWITVPGLLLMLILRVGRVDFWTYLSYAVGSSMAFLLFVGLLIDVGLPLLGVARPLSSGPLVCGLTVPLLAAIPVALRRNGGAGRRLAIGRPSRAAGLRWLDVAHIVAPVPLVGLGVLGPLSLNNGGPATLTMLLLLGIAVYVFSLVACARRLNERIYPFAVVMIALALLLMTSLRGWYISGHDVLEEFLVFQVTLVREHWSPANVNHTFNTCLSITLLPTVFASLLHVAPTYVYKVIFQVLFALAMAPLFSLLRRYVDGVYALLATFVFMSSLPFFTDLPFLIRQQTAFLFFILVLLVLFDKALGQRVRGLLFVLFGFAMIVSHYATAYVALGLFILTYALCLGYRATRTRRGWARFYGRLRLADGHDLDAAHPHLRGPLLLLLCSFTLLWYVGIGGDGKDLVTLGQKVAQSIGNNFTRDTRSSDAAYSLFSWQAPNPRRILADYLGTISKQYHRATPPSAFYPASSYARDRIGYVAPRTLPLTALGRAMDHAHLAPTLVIGLLRQLFARLLQVLILVGLVALLYSRRRLHALNVEFVFLSFVGVLFLGLITVASVDYGIGRAYQQCLIILCLPTVLGGAALFRGAREHRRALLVALLLLLSFGVSSSLIPQAIGGYEPQSQLFLNNQGYYYDAYYTHRTDIASIQWLQAHRDGHDPIQADRFAGLKLFAFTGSQPLEGIHPAVLYKDAYVYLDDANVTQHKAYAYYRETFLAYTVPKTFLDHAKNRIYDNGSAEVYR